MKNMKNYLTKKKVNPTNFNLKEIKEISNEMVNAYMKKYEKLG